MDEFGWWIEVSVSRIIGIRKMRNLEKSKSQTDDNLARSR